MSGPGRPLGATYRLQLHGEFPLSGARDIVGYLRELGVTHLYASPVLGARRGSTHGYDVVDPTVVNPEIGGDAAWRELIEALHGEGLGAVLDVVPNHMSASLENPYWADVLRRGRASSYAHWFDIDWESPHGAGKVMLPVLGDELEQVLEQGELEMVEEDGERAVGYFDQRFPLDPDASTDGPIADVIARQHYRLASWRRASTEINYRRFFDVNDLVALRAEDPRVFEATHARVLEWVRSGALDGVRIDHVDGLLDPAAYLERLRAAAGADTPIFVEKILSRGERLRETWPVQGTTGYEFLNGLEDLFVSAPGFRKIETAYLRMIGQADAAPRFAEEGMTGKREVLRAAFQADVERIARLLGDDAGASTADALVEFIAHLPVYRTYLDGRGGMHEDDARFLKLAIDGAGAGDSGTGRIARAFDDAARGEEGPLRFAKRFQQTSGPATAKGVEDTAIYRYVPLVSRNEVGGGPEHSLDGAVERFHEANAERRRRWPRSLLCTNTHDTKRSADVRARVAALSEMPDEWLAAVARWRAMNAPHRVPTATGPAPDANDEYLLYQTILGAWPAMGEREPDLDGFRERVKAYMEKAMREAKRITSWTDPDEAYERGVAAFVDALLARENEPLLRDVARFADPVVRAAMWTSLSRVALHLTSPGTPDTYQGDELWNLALVDPDNRRPVDYAVRARMLHDLDAGSANDAARERLLADMVAAPGDGRVKLWTVSRLLRARRARLALFGEGDYLPLAVRGLRAGHLVAFARLHAGAASITLAPRLALTLSRTAPPTAESWGDTEVVLPAAPSRLRYRCAVSGTTPPVRTARDGGSVSVADALRFFPVAVLLSEA